MKLLFLISLAACADLLKCPPLKHMNGTECTSSKSLFSIDKSTLIQNCNACYQFNSTAPKAYGKQVNKEELLKKCLKRVELGDRSPSTPIGIFSRDGCPASANLPQTTARGSGCPTGSFAIAPANDRLTFTLIFDSFIVSSPSPTTSLQCEILVDLGGTSTTVFDLDKVDIRGFALISGDVKAKLTSSYRFKGAKPGETTSLLLDTTGDFVFTKNITTPDKFKCSKRPLLIIKTRIELTGDLNSTSIFSVDSKDTKLSPSMVFSNRTC